MVRIPAYSRHLHISEHKESPSYLALKEASGQPRLNGNWVLDWPGRYKAAGTVFSYRRWPGKSESLVAKGPTTEELIVEVHDCVLVGSIEIFLHQYFQSVFIHLENL